MHEIEIEDNAKVCTTDYLCQVIRFKEKIYKPIIRLVL